MRARPGGRLAVALVGSVVALGLLGGCGGKDDNNSGERPTIESMTASVKATSEVGDAQAACIAEGLFNSTLPNGVLRKVSKSETADVDEDSRAGYDAVIEQIRSGCAAMDEIPG